MHRATKIVATLGPASSDPQVLPRWVIPLGNWAWDALTEETPLTDAGLQLEPYQVRWFVQPA